MVRSKERRVLGAEFALGLALVLIRLASANPHRLWRDWLFILGLFGLFWGLTGRSDAGPAGLLCVVAYLAAIHAVGLLPHVLAVWGVTF